MSANQAEQQQSKSYMYVFIQMVGQRQLLVVPTQPMTVEVSNIDYSGQFFKSSFYMLALKKKQKNHQNPTAWN